MSSELERLLKGIAEQEARNAKLSEEEKRKNLTETLSVIAEQEAQANAATAQAQQMVGGPTSIYDPASFASGPMASLAHVPKIRMQQRGREGANSLLSALQSVQGMSVFDTPATSGFQTMDIQQNMDERRKIIKEQQLLLNAIRKETPLTAGVADGFTTLAEMMVGGKAFRHANPRLQKVGTSAKEAGIGAAFGATTVGMSDDEKAAMIATGFLVGAISPSVVQYGIKQGGRLMTFSVDRIRHIREMAYIEDLFDKAGILSLGEMIGGKNNFLKLEAALDNIPFLGFTKKREAQQIQFLDITESLFERLTGRSFREEPQRVAEYLQESLTKRYVRIKNMLDRDYDDIARRLDDIPVGAQPSIRLQETKQTVARLLDDELDMLPGVQNKDVLDALKTFTGDKEAITFRQARKTLSELKSKANDAAVRAKLGEDGARQLRRALVQIELSLITDMRAWAKAFSPSVASHSNLMGHLESVNERYKRLLLPFYKTPVVQDMVEGLDFAIDDIATAFLVPSRTGNVSLRRAGMQPPPTTPREARTRLSSMAAPPLRQFDSRLDLDIATPSQKLDLTATEQRMWKFLTLRNALDRSTGLQGTSRMTINPTSFLDELDKTAKAFNVNFTKVEMEQLTGYARLVELAGKRAFQPPTALGPLISGGTIIGMGMFGGDQGTAGMATLLGGTIGARIILGTKLGTGIARRMANAATDTEMQNAMRDAQILITRYLSNKFPQMAPEFIQEIKEMGSLFTNSPYSGFNPITDPYLQMHPPPKEFVRR